MSVGEIIAQLRRACLLDAGDVVVDQRPRAYLGPWPILSHRTLAEVDAR